MTMKQFMIVAIAMLAVVAFATPGFANLAANATCNVNVTVNPNVSLVPVNVNVNAGTVETGNFTAFCQFRVDANQEAVAFQVNASSLYKGDVPTTTIKIPVNTTVPVGCVSDSGQANAKNFHPNFLAFNGLAGPLVSGFTTFSTESVAYESSQAGTFSQVIDITVTYNQGDPQLPTGEYSGVVQLIATLLPTTGG
jgi:hypothetical protein